MVLALVVVEHRDGDLVKTSTRLLGGASTRILVFDDLVRTSVSSSKREASQDTTATVIRRSEDKERPGVVGTGAGSGPGPGTGGGSGAGAG